MNGIWGIIGAVVMLVGLVLSVVGMCSYTGIVGLGLPSAVMYAGYAVTVAGMAILYLDMCGYWDSRGKK